MAPQKEDLDNCYLELDGAGILELHINPGQVLQPDDIHKIFDTIHRLFPSATCLMVTAGKKATLSQEARNLVSSAGISDQIKYDAIVTEHYSHQMAANFFVRHNEPSRPTQLFKTVEDAREWLTAQLG
jgi:hypothetical protein